jgi:hypothetical protein
VGKGLKRGPKGYVDGGLGGQGKIPRRSKVSWELKGESLPITFLSIILRRSKRPRIYLATNLLLPKHEQTKFNCNIAFLRSDSAIHTSMHWLNT